MKIVFVGEAWGRSEDQMKHPLVGASGRELSLLIGKSELGPFLTKRCRECKKQTRFIEPHCEFCHEHVWPNEFDLMDHWKFLRRKELIHVTNVFNMKPPDICLDCGSHNIRVERAAVCRDCKSRHIRTNEIGWLFGTEKETEMPGWKASKDFGGSHLKQEFFPHVQRLWSELSALKPNLIIALGNAACWALLGQTKISALRGTVNWSDRLGLKVLPTYHPAAVLRQFSWRPTVIADLQKANRESNFPEIRRPERWITIPAPTQEGLDEIKTWLSDPEIKRLACDIETVRGQISIIGFAKTRSLSLVVPFRDCHSKNGKLVDIGAISRFIGADNSGVNYWPTSDLESSAWHLCSTALESKRIELIFQNGIYDMSYFLKMGIHPRAATDDTMLWHHAEYPELPKSLGFLGSLYLNEVSWKQMNRETDSLKRDE